MPKESKFRIEDFKGDVGGMLDLDPDVLDFIREVANRHHVPDIDVIKGLFMNGLNVIQAVDLEGATCTLRLANGTEEVVDMLHLYEDRGDTESH